MTNDETIIEVSSGWSLPDWRILIRHRDLLFVLVQREFISKYKQTVLGPAWYIAQPILTSILFTAIFSRAAGISTEGVPPILFYLCGLLSWGYFVGCLESISQSLLHNSHIFQKIYFPRILLPLSLVLSKLYSYAIQLAVLIGFMIYFHFASTGGFSFQWRGALWQFPILLFQSAALALGVGLWVAALSTRYRDFQHLMGFLIPIWMYATPIIYPLSLMNDHWRTISYFNPMCSITEGYRSLFFGVGGVGTGAHLVSFLITAILLVTGLVVFERIERRFVDTL